MSLKKNVATRVLVTYDNAKLRLRGVKPRRVIHLLAIKFARKLGLGPRPTLVYDICSSMRFIAALYILPSVAYAATWHTVEWDAPKFTALSGDFVIPKLPSTGGTPYVWPALQSSKGVLQAVCDGR
jgi:hypothetical protein